MPFSIVVVGAGIGGLAAGIALRQAGHNVTILERHKTKREVGFAVSVPPNCTRVLSHLGIDFDKARMTEWRGLDQVRADVTPLEWEPGPFVDAVKQWGSPQLVAHRVDLHETMWAKAIDPAGQGQPVKIMSGCNVVKYDVAGNVTFDDGSELAADLVIAADGIGSKAHISVIGEERPVTNSKTINLRFVVPTSALAKNPLTSDLVTKGNLRAGVYYNKANDRGLYRSPCRNNTLQNFGVFYMDDTNASQVVDRSVKATPDMALELLKDFDESFKEICRLADANDMFFWRLADRDPLPSFHSGRLVLLGDACHPMQPHFGQGASQAIADAGVLGIMLHGLDSPQEISSRLKLYESLRKSKASAIQLLSRSEGMDFELSTETIRKARAFATEDEVPQLTRFGISNWIHGHDYISEARATLKQRSVGG